MELFHGDIIYSGSDRQFSIHEDSYIAVENGLVEGIYSSVPESLSALPVTDYGRALIIPAFSDLHIHAPQYSQRGTCMDQLLTDWLSLTTFPEEAKFADTAYAEKVYTLLARDMLRNGTFHACVFASLHTPSAILLADILEKHGLRGFVGKVNMDMNSPEYLCESTEKSLYETEVFLSALSAERQIRPILTPRFAPTCSRELLCGLGKLSSKYGCGMQSHIVESKWEAAESVRLFPECASDTEIYERAGLLENGPSVLAHFIFPTEEDIRIAEKHGAVTVHCPDATNNIIAGIMPAGRLTDRCIPIALGTDIGAGSRPAVYSQIARTVQLSKLKNFYEPESSRAVSFAEAFYYATRAGGSVFGRTGFFEKGCEFDALVITSLEDADIELPPEKRLERFCYNGDDRNISAGYIRGKKVTL